MNAFFRKKPVKAVLGVALCLSLVVAVCNAVFAKAALEEQKGVAVCDPWSKASPFDPQKITSLEMGRGDFKILCLTDIHIRNRATFGAALGVNLVLDGMSRFQLRSLLEREQPDLIVITGDTVLTAWNDIALQQFSDFMDGFEIPWAHVYGNHDYEGRADKAKLSEILSNSKYGLFQCGPEGMNGMGNYALSLKRGGKPVYTLFFLDNGQFRPLNGEITDGGISKNQIDWFNWTTKGIRTAAGGSVPSMAFFHVPIPEYETLEAGFQQGGRREGTCAAKTNDGFFDAFKAAGGTHLFAGHDHNNNFITDYEGVTLCYVTKSSYNCYFTFDALGGTLITLNHSNTPTVSLATF